jgi:hypothetical protein
LALALRRAAVSALTVGAAPVDLFRKARTNWSLEPIHITPGHTIHRDRGVWYIPKRELVADVAIKLTGRIKIVPELPEAEILKEELKNFKCKMSSSGHDTYGAGGDWGGDNNDDLVLATALALSGERIPSRRLTCWSLCRGNQLPACGSIYRVTTHPFFR